MNKPEPLFIDGEVFSVKEEEIDGMPYVIGAHMSLSPYEAQELRDWLTQFIVWETWDRKDTEKER
jgi:hypothetical protein